MRQKELRIALVCFGGVSLAIYMHGITKEILKLARASRALHAIRDRNTRSASHFFDLYSDADDEYDTESVYYDLLREIGRTLELRVVVDIIAGASAGGINGVMLSRALSHDLPMGRLRDLWLENADVSKLLASDAKARKFSKWFLRPFLWIAEKTNLKGMADPEARSNISLFLRSRWFKPPLDGPKMAALMYDAVSTMGAGEPGSSLVPVGQSLDLFVTVTDFYGCQELRQIHDPPMIHEREHRHVLHFKHRLHHDGSTDSSFELDNAGGLAFAARATSSIPGAFPPATIDEIDQLIKARFDVWPRRSDFIQHNFERHVEMNVDVTSVPFVDGGVLNSRPFREAIAAIRGRAAYREVDRRLVYVDPNPATPGFATHHGMPGFFETLRGALSDLPLKEPLTDELSWVDRLNDRVRRLKAIIEGARPHISELVARIIGDGSDSVTEDQIRTWREKANVRAAHDAGYAYEAYVRLKLASAQSVLTRIIAALRGVRNGSPYARAIASIVNAWALQTGVTYDLKGTKNLDIEEIPESNISSNWARFLLTFDIEYRKRRLHFLIEGQNRLYQIAASAGGDYLHSTSIDSLKRHLYNCVDALERLEADVSTRARLVQLVEDIFRVVPSPQEMRDLDEYARGFVEKHSDKLSSLIDEVATAIDLKSSTREIDTIIGGLQGWSRPAIREVLVNYLGFPFWDVLTFPVLPWGQTGEFDEIRIDRISARDATWIAQMGEFPLKGAGFNQFAAFLSRAFRENDYLLGRLHAADRLFDIVCDSAGNASESKVAELKRSAFLRILDAEEPHLATCRTMISEIRSAMFSSASRSAQ